MSVRGAIRVVRRGGPFIAGWLALSTTGAIAKDLISDHLAGPATIVHGSGAAGTFNVVVMGDGFTADSVSIGAYRDAVDKFITKWMGTEPFKSLSEALTVYRLDVISDEPGIDVPKTCGGEPFDTPPLSNGDPFNWSRSAKHPNNILESHWCAEDVLSGKSKKRFLGPKSESDRVAKFALASGVVPNMTIVIVNDWMFGATAFADDGVVYVSLSQNLVGDINPDTGKLLTPNEPNSFPAVAVHEIGHLAPFRLLDEYSTNRPQTELAGEKAVIDASPNLTTVLSPLPWEALLAAGTSRPTDCEDKHQVKPDVGAAIGGYGFGDKVYHSRCTCKMDDYSGAEFCLVCRRYIESRLAPFLPKPPGH